MSKGAGMITGNLLKTYHRLVLTSVVLALGIALPSVVAKLKLHKGEWVITLRAPDSSSGNHFGVRTAKIRATQINTPKSSEEIREFKGTMDAETPIYGVWRQEGRRFSLTFELPCEADTACGTIILRGKLRSKTQMDGTVILMWDTPDRSNVARYETVNGTFEGIRQ